MAGRSASSVDAGYALSNSWERARQRLAHLEATYDEASFRRAAALGVGPGWRCLDAGAGHGSFARWLADRVGGDGHVLAVDVDVRLLEEAEPPGVEIRRLDLATDPLPGGFDLVHTRLVLLHLPQRDEILRRLAAAVRPGGLLMIEEDDVHPLSANPPGPYRDAWDAFMTFMRRAGLDGEWARGLPERLEALGLADVGAELDGQLFPGRSDTARFWSLTWLEVRDRAAALGIDPEVLDRGREALEDSSRWFLGPARVIAWGRVPGHQAR